MLVLLILIALIIGADQLTKWLAVVYLQNGDSVYVIPGVFRFVFVKNDGAAFGMLDNHRWVFMILSTVAIIGLLIFLWRKPPKSRLCRIAMAFLIGGGIGNMIDRVLLGYVIDFLDFCAFPSLWKWVFNVADAFVTVGTGMIMFYLIREIILEMREEKKKKTESVSDAPASEPESPAEEILNEKTETEPQSSTENGENDDDSRDS